MASAVIDDIVGTSTRSTAFAPSATPSPPHHPGTAQTSHVLASVDLLPRSRPAGDLSDLPVSKPPPLLNTDDEDERSDDGTGEMPSLHDTRLLANLIRVEKETMMAFKLYTNSAASASAALTAWSTADSGGTEDLMEISIRISQLLAACTDSQRQYLNSLSAYRTSLKDVLERETGLRTIVRDREILVGRLIKLGNKKPAESGLESHQSKLEDAQRELSACETFLQDEEASLNGLKRRNFRESFSMRMRSMAQLGKVMQENAHEAIALLSQLDQGYADDRDDLGSAAGDSITPSHSASQARSHASSTSSLSDIPYPEFSLPAPHQLSKSSVPTYPSAVKPLPLPTSRSRTVSLSTERARSPPPPVLPVVPITARGNDTPFVPLFEIPKAPPNVSSRRPADDSSDEEDARQFAAHQGIASTRSVSAPKQDGRLRRKAHSETSSIIDRGGRARSTSFFGGIAALFKGKKRRERERSEEEESNARGLGSQWETRTDRNVFAASRSGTVGSGTTRRKVETPSDEEDMPKHLIRVVNDPKKRLKALSDVGVSTSTSKVRSVEKRKSSAELGGSVPMLSRPFPTSMSSPGGLDVGAVGGEVVKKRKKRISTMSAPPPQTTIVLSSNGIASPSPSSPATFNKSSLSRSNTVMSASTILTTGTTNTTNTNGEPVKRKKKRAVSVAPTLPTVADLAASLPSARSSMSIYTPPSLSPISYPSENFAGSGSKVPKSIARDVKTGKRESALHGNGNWIAVPTSPSPTIPTTPTMVTRKVYEAEESLMSVVDRSEREGDSTSRTYGSKPSKSTLPISPPTSLGSTSNLVKRKSVRLAEISGLLDVPSHSPPASIRSDPSSTPRHGILVNGAARSPSPLGVNDMASTSRTGWDTRLNNGRGAAGDDSESEDEGYAEARRQFEVGTRGLEGWIGTGKGKGREQ